MVTSGATKPKSEERYTSDEGFKISSTTPFLTTTVSSRLSCATLCTTKGDACFTVVVRYVTEGTLTCELYSRVRDSYTLVADSDAQMMWRSIDVVVGNP